MHWYMYTCTYTDQRGVLISEVDLCAKLYCLGPQKLSRLERYTCFSGVLLRDARIACVAHIICAVAWNFSSVEYIVYKLF